MIKNRIFLLTLLFLFPLVAYSFDYNINVDNVTKLNSDNNKYLVVFHVENNKNEVVLANCSIMNQKYEIGKIFKKEVIIENKTHILIMCRIDNKLYYLLTPLLKYIKPIKENKTNYYFKIEEPIPIVYNQENRFVIHTICQNVSVIVGSKEYSLEYNPFKKIFERVIYIPKGSIISFKLNCDNKTVIKPFLKDYIYVEVPKYDLYLTQQNIYDLNKDIFIKIKVFNNVNKLFENNLTKLKVTFPNKLYCNKSKDSEGLIVDCRARDSGNYSINICYTNICKVLNISVKELEQNNNIILLKPDLKTTYFVNGTNSSVFFRFKYVGLKPKEIKELKNNISLKSDDHTFFGYLPLKKGKNMYIFNVTYIDQKGNKKNLIKNYTVYGSDKIPTILINVNKSYTLNKTDRILIPIIVKYENNTLETGKVYLFVNCGDYSSMSELKYDYELQGFYGIYYVGDSGNCLVKATYYDRNYVTVSNETEFKVIIPEKKGNIIDGMDDIAAIIVILTFTIILIIFIKYLI